MKRRADALFVGIALLMLLLPAWGLLRAKAPFAYDARDAYIAENIGFRPELITLHARVSRRLFSQTGNEQVLLGKDGWLYFADTMPDFYRRNALEDAQIDQIASSIAALSQVLARQGIGFTFLCAPNKNTVYPEHMPCYASPAEGAGNLERLQAALVERGVDVLDAAALLRARKPEGQLYFKTDTHWNARGALVVYRALMERLAQGEPGIAHESFEAYDAYEVPLEDIVTVQGDLAALYLPLSKATETDARPAMERRYAVDGVMRSLSDMMIRTRSDANGLRVLVLRDSFGEALFPYMANNLGRLLFSRVLSVDEAAIQGLIQGEEIRHVVLQIAERNLPTLL